MEDAWPCRGQTREEGIIGVHHHDGRLWQGCNGAPPALRDDLELAVAVELVAEEICEADSAWLDLAGDLGKCALVDLEEPQGGTPGLEERRGDSRHKVCPGAVVSEGEPPSEDLRSHRGSGGLSVGRRDERGAFGEPTRERGDRFRIDSRQDLPRQCGSAAACGQP